VSCLGPSLEDTQRRLAELRADRDSHVLGHPSGFEEPDPEGWAEENPELADELAELEYIEQRNALVNEVAEITEHMSSEELDELERESLR